MQILADNNMSGLDQTFARQGNLTSFDGRTLTRDDLGEAEVLLVRSVTNVGASLLQGSKVRFVGTATIGTDHLDTTWLDQAGIAWASAPGCNADAAAQYTLGMLLLAMQRLGKQAADQQVAIVGYGNVGSRLHKLLDTLGVAVVVCDPPLEERGQLQSLTLADALQADIISLHVPLQRGGAHPTHHMLNRKTLAQMRTGALLINASRGDVVQEGALVDELRVGRLYAALDVWPSEPCVNPSLLAATTVATPHVAGSSVEGKRRGTDMIFTAFMAWRGQSAGLECTGVADDKPAAIPRPANGNIPLGAALDDTIIHATHVAQDDARMRAANFNDAASFDALRRAHAPRHEFNRLTLPSVDSQTGVTLRSLGFLTTP